VRTFTRLAALTALLGAASPLALTVAGCSSSSGDPHAVDEPSALGNGKRVREVVDPSRGLAGADVVVTAAEVTAVDTFDETRNGKSRGTVFVQDVSSSSPFSGVSLYSPTFIPANLRVGAGDVLDLAGQYTENAKIGSHAFPPGQVLPQLSKPTATFRYEYAPIEPTTIDVNDLADYKKGRAWMNMLVRLENVEIPDALFDDGSGRLTAHLTKTTTLLSSPVLTNELADLPKSAIQPGTYRSIVGIVTYFDQLHLAPRSLDDITR